jgi:S1-C subfamily serine protease
MDSTEIEELLENIQELQSILIGVATGEYRIQEKDEEYKQLSQEISSQIEDFQYEGLQIENPNNFQSLWDWHKYYKSKLRKSALRAGYIHNLYQDICSQLDLVLYTNYIESASPEILNKVLEPAKIQELKSKIEQLQSLMIDVATQSDVTSLIQKKEQEYSKLYQEVGLHIAIIQNKGIAVSNPNDFRSLWQWNSFYFDEYASYARKEYINNLYLDFLKPFDRALKKYSNKPNANQEFIQYIKSRLKPVNNILPTKPVIAVNSSSNLQENNIGENQSFVEEFEQIPNTNYLTLETDDYSFNWTFENCMNPERFLEQEDIFTLESSLEKVFSSIDTTSSLKSIFTTSGIKNPFINKINFNSNIVEITNIVVAKFRDFKISDRQLDYHPLINLLQYLLKRQESYELEDEDIELFNRLVEKGEQNFKALKARKSIVRIESPIGNAIGTGVLIANNLLLTCYHIFTKTQVKQAWARFDYKSENNNSDRNLFELDTNFIINRNQPDFALLKIKSQVQRKSISINENSILDSGEEIRIIHHPQGKPLLISNLGEIIQVGEDYIDHNLQTDDGSSGAPIFNNQWELIAIHQGNVGISRDFEPNTTAGIPIRSIWNQISPHLN